MKKIYTNSEEETRREARRLAKTLRPGTIVLLYGGLGSGKTTFVKGLAEGMGVAGKEDVTSPTFVLMHIYQGKVPLYHFDLYRLESDKELEAIGFDEFLSDAGAVCCVEWPERAASFFTGNELEVRLEILEKNRRLLILGKEQP